MASAGVDNGSLEGSIATANQLSVSLHRTKGLPLGSRMDRADLVCFRPVAIGSLCAISRQHFNFPEACDHIRRS